MSGHARDADDVMGCFRALSEAGLAMSEATLKFDKISSAQSQLQQSFNPSHAFSQLQTNLHQLNLMADKEKERKKKVMNAKILKMLRGPVDLPVVARLVAHLKEQAGKDGMIPADSLPAIFLQCRQSFINDWIAKNIDTDDVFRRACGAMRGPVLAVLTEYYDNFDAIEPIAALISRHFIQFLDAVQVTVAKDQSLFDLASQWNELVVLEDEFKPFHVSFMHFVSDLFIQRATSIAIAHLESAIEFFIKSINRTTVPATPGPHMKSIPPFVMLINAFTKMFKDVTQFCPPALIPRLEAAVDTKLASVEEALADADSVRAVYTEELRPFIQSCFQRLQNALKK